MTAPIVACRGHRLLVLVRSFYEEFERWPSDANDSDIDSNGHYPDGGTYALEEAGVIRIQFTVKPELIRGLGSHRAV